ncbi:hypothetical protein I3A86_25035 [Salmonella enterica]|nr:hypothetical protein [Salmonella enterica]
MSGRAPSRRARRALLAVEAAAITVSVALGVATAGTHPILALTLAGIAAFLTLAAIAVALTPEA